MMFHKIIGTASTQSTDSILVEETTQKINAFSKYWQDIDWEKLISHLISKSISIVLTIILIVIIKKLGDKFIHRSFLNHKNQSENRVETLLSLSLNVFHYTLLFIFIYTILTIIGIPVGSLLAGAGIAGVAIGLGAQGFINDIITGFFIIFEKQIEVGDYVIIENFEGNVQSVGLRTTEIKSYDGIIHFIPNRSILVISNLSKANRLAIVKLRIDPSNDIEEIKEILKEVNDRLTPTFPEITSPPEIQGVVDIGNGALAIKVTIRTLNGSQIKVQSAFLEEYITALSDKGIDIPSSPINLSSTQ